MDTPDPIHTTVMALSRIRKGDNPRRYFDRKKHEELVASIARRGMLQPILLRLPTDGGDIFPIIAGERRYRAALEVFGPDGQVPVRVRAMSNQEALEAAIDENDVRDDASETEQADAAVRILAACGDDRAEAARRLCWSASKLDRRLALANLAETVKRALDERQIKVGHAELLAAVPPDKQERALATILSSGLDVGKTRDLLMRVTQALAGACFDKTECTTCPFNSGTQRALFEAHVDDGYCTNPACFELKTAAVEEARFQAERVAELEEPDEQEALTSEPDAAQQSADGVVPSGTSPDPLTSARSSVRSAARPASTAATIASRTTDLREATWRTAVARALAGNAAHARVAILVAAMTGTLPHIKAETLRARAGLLIDATFPSLDFPGKIIAIRALSDDQAATVLSAIGAAYARDVPTFANVAYLARAFDVDLRDTWKVDQTFLVRFTKDELRFIGHECGLVSHVGDKAFARLLGAKKADLVAGMLHATGFDWAGRLPSAMTLDAQYGPPPGPCARTEQSIEAIAA